MAALIGASGTRKWRIRLEAGGKTEKRARKKVGGCQISSWMTRFLERVVGGREGGGRESRYRRGGSGLRYGLSNRSKARQLRFVEVEGRKEDEQDHLESVKPKFLPLNIFQPAPPVRTQAVPEGVLYRVVHVHDLCVRRPN